MRIVALDPGLQTTGLAYAQSGQAPVIMEIVSRPRGRQERIARIADIIDQVMEAVPVADLCVIEGYSYASRGNSLASLAELGGCLRMACLRAGVPVAEVAPAARALYATGSGRATKEAVLAAAIRRLGYAGDSPDEADALWLLAMAQDQYLGVCRVPAHHRRALERVTWPEVYHGC